MAEDLLVPSGATQTDMEEEQGYPHLWSTAAELQQTVGNKGYSGHDLWCETFGEDTLTGEVHKKFSSMSTIVYAVGQERFGTMKTKEEASPVNPIDARKRYRDKLRTEIDSLTKQCIRLRNINWQDWKYTSFAIFICHNQNIRRHSAIGGD